MENDKEALAACKLRWKEVSYIFIRALFYSLVEAFHNFAENHVSSDIPAKI